MFYIPRHHICCLEYTKAFLACKKILFCLQLLHGGDVGGLDVVLVVLDGLLQVVQGDLVVLDDTVDLDLLDTETDWDELVGTPDKAVHLDGLGVGEHLLEVGLVVPWLDVQGDDGLGGWLRWLGGLLGVVCGDSLGLELLGGLVVLVVGAE